MGGSPTPPHLEPPEIAGRRPEVRKRKERGRWVREEGEFSVARVCEGEGGDYIYNLGKITVNYPIVYL